VATRKSALALAQSRAFIARLAARYPAIKFEELLVVTTGDVVQDRALAEIGGKGLFSKRIEEALLDGRADIAIHSLKDVPPRFAVAEHRVRAEREDPRDVLVTRGGVTLAQLAAVAVSAPARCGGACSCWLTGRDSRWLRIRGNVDTRHAQMRKAARVDAGGAGPRRAESAGLGRPRDPRTSRPE